MQNKKTLHIYLFRHGQTFYNREHRFSGLCNTKLTKKGLQNAKNIAKRLKNKKIDISFCSRLSRSKKTLAEVLKYHKECKDVKIDNRIIERTYGKLDGMQFSQMIKACGKHDYEILLHNHKIHHLHGKERKDFEKKHGLTDLKIVKRSYSHVPEDGESIKMIEGRVKSFIKDLIKMMKRGELNVAICSHDNSMRPLRRYFERLSVNDMMNIENPHDKVFEYKIRV